MKIAVVGLGKIGTALAAHYASRGHTVLGCDINEQTVDVINAGKVAGQEEPGLAALVERVVASGCLRATRDTSAAVRASDAVVVIVPLLVDHAKQPDYRAIDSAVRDIARGLQRGTLVTFETTLPVGDCRTRFGPLLEQGSGLRVGRDFCLAFGPERVQSGRILHDLATYPKVVGGVDAGSTNAAVHFYRAVLDVPIIEVTSAETAEFVKLAQSYYRDVNIALANELAMCATSCGVDALEAIRVANTDPYAHIHQPGIGVGGHCIPVYPYFFIDRFATTRLLQAAREINDGMAVYSVDLLEAAIGPLDGKRVVILGMAFRANVKEATFSMATLVVQELHRRNAIALVHDPLFTVPEMRAWGVEPVDLDAAEHIDAVIIHSYHEQYRTLDFRRFTACQVILDGRNCLPDEVIGTLPCRYIRIGGPAPTRPSHDVGRVAMPAQLCVATGGVL